jgi:hypothetical protein
MRFLGFLIVLAGCPSGPAMVNPDAAHDGMPPAAGMFVGWQADPALPGPLSDKVSVSEVSFRVSNFVVVGDGGAGDSRTTHASYELEWKSSGGPAQEVFPDAPAGMYSKVYLDFNVSRDSHAYEIRGVWRDQGTSRPFKVEDDERLQVTLDCTKVLVGGAATIFEIRVDLRNALTGIDFAKLEEDDGVLELKSGPELAKFRTTLAKSAFKVDD